MYMELYCFSVLLFLLNVVLYNLHGHSIHSKIFFVPTMDKAVN